MKKDKYSNRLATIANKNFLFTHKHTDRQTDIATTRLTWPGAESVKMYCS